MIDAATSSTVPPRFIGTPLLRRSTRPGSAAAGVYLGVDQPGADCVDTDAFVAHLTREADRQRVDRRLGRGVVHVLVGRADTRRGGEPGRVAGSSVSGGHAAHGFAAAQERVAALSLLT